MKSMKPSGHRTRRRRRTICRAVATATTAVAVALISTHGAIYPVAAQQPTITPLGYNEDESLQSSEGGSNRRHRLSMHRSNTAPQHPQSQGEEQPQLPLQSRELGRRKNDGKKKKKKHTKNDDDGDGGAPRQQDEDVEKMTKREKKHADDANHLDDMDDEDQGRISHEDVGTNKRKKKRDKEKEEPTATEEDKLSKQELKKFYGKDKDIDIKKRQKQNNNDRNDEASPQSNPSDSGRLDVNKRGKQNTNGRNDESSGDDKESSGKRDENKTKKDDGSWGSIKFSDQCTCIRWGKDDGSGSGNDKEPRFKQNGPTQRDIKNQRKKDGIIKGSSSEVSKNDESRRELQQETSQSSSSNDESELARGNQRNNNKKKENMAARNSAAWKKKLHQQQNQRKKKKHQHHNARASSTSNSSSESTSESAKASKSDKSGKGRKSSKSSKVCLEWACEPTPPPVPTEPTPPPAMEPPPTGTTTDSPSPSSAPPASKSESPPSSPAASPTDIPPESPSSSRTGGNPTTAAPTNSSKPTGLTGDTWGSSLSKDESWGSSSSKDSSGSKDDSWGSSYSRDKDSRTSKDWYDDDWYDDDWYDDDWGSSKHDWTHDGWSNGCKDTQKNKRKYGWHDDGWDSSCEPSVMPSVSSEPSVPPSTMPSHQPSLDPPESPSLPPTMMPTQSPSNDPSGMPSYEPTPFPTVLPTFSPTETTPAPTDDIDISKWLFWGASEGRGEDLGKNQETPEFIYQNIRDVSPGSRHTFVINQKGKAIVSGFIESMGSYKGHMGVKRADLSEGSNKDIKVGRVIAVQNTKLREVPAPKFKKVYAGAGAPGDSRDMHSLLIDRDNNVYTAGYNGKGQLCHNDTKSRDVFQKVEGIPGPVVSAAVGLDFTLLLLADGSVYGCGSNEGGELGLGNNITISTVPESNGLTDIEAVYAGLSFALYLKKDGEKVFGSGSNIYGQMCEFTEGKPLLTPEGKPKELFSFSNVDGLLVEQIRAGRESSYFLVGNGSVFSCGRNNEGQLGSGTTNDSNFPVTVKLPAGISIRDIGSGTSSQSAFFISDGKAVYGVGQNYRYNLGIGNSVSQSTPVLLDLNDFVIEEISSSGTHTIAISGALRPQPTKNPTKQPTPRPSSPPIEGGTYCGCPAECPEAWGVECKYNGFVGTCGQRIEYYQTNTGGGLSEQESCKKVAVDECQFVCSQCNPNTCGAIVEP